MTLFEQVAPGAVAPGLASAGVFVAAAWLARRRPSERAFELGPALAIAAGFAAGLLVVLRRWPSLPLTPGEAAWTWVAWFAPLGVLVGTVESRGPLPRAVVVVGRGLVALGAAWLVVGPHAQAPLGEKWTWALVAALATCLVWTVAARASGRRERPDLVALPLGVAAGATAAIFALLSGSLALGQVTGALSAALLTTYALGWVLRRPATSRTAAPVVALAFGGLLLGAYAYLNYADAVYFPASSALLLALGAVGGVVLPSLLPARASRWLVVAAGALPPALLAGVAAWLAHAAAPPPSPYG